MEHPAISKSLKPKRRKSSLRIQVLQKKLQVQAPSSIGIYFTRPLFSAIRNQFRRGNPKEAARLLSALLSSGNCTTEFAFRAGVSLLGKDLENSSLLVDYIRNFKKSSGLVQSQVRLYRGIAFLLDDNFQKAHDVFSESSHHRVPSNLEYQNELSLTVSGYKSLLSVLLKKPDTVASTVLSDLYAHDAPFVAFVQAYGETLHQNEGPEWVRSFVEDWCSRSEAKDYGIIPFLQGLQLLDSVIPTSRKLKFNLLQQLSDINPSDPNVLTFCTMLLRNEVPSSDSDDDDSSSEFDDSGNEEESVTPEQRTDNLTRCLRLIMEHLDYPDNHHSATAWAVLADCLSYICLLGGRRCARALSSEWHRDRKYWWPSVHFHIVTVKIENSELTQIGHKVLACFVLESENHPFVVSALSTLGNWSLHIKNSFNQLRSRKRLLDAEIDRCTASLPVLPSLSVPSVPPVADDDGISPATTRDDSTEACQKAEFLDLKSLAHSYGINCWKINDVIKGDGKSEDSESSDESDSNEEENGEIDVRLLANMILHRRRENIEKRRRKRRKVDAGKECSDF